MLNKVLLGFQSKPWFISYAKKINIKLQIKPVANNCGVTLLDRWVLSFDINLNGLQGAHSNVCPYGYVKKFDTSPFLLLFFSRGSRYVDFDFLFESSFFFFQNPPARHSTLPHGELERQTNSLSRSSFFKTHQPTTQTFPKGNLRIFLLNYSSLWETFVFFSPHWRVLPRLKTCSRISSFFYW